MRLSYAFTITWCQNISESQQIQHSTDKLLLVFGIIFGSLRPSGTRLVSVILEKRKLTPYPWNSEREKFRVDSKIFNSFRFSFLALAVVYFFSFYSNDVKASPSVVVAYDSVISDLQLQIKELESKLKECEKNNTLKTDETYSRYVKLTTKSSVSTTISTLPIAKSDDREKLAVEDIRAESIAERYQTAKKILIENWKEPLRPG